MGLGAGAFWDGIEAMGGRRLTAAQSVDALHEAIQIIREIWNTDERGGVRVKGTYYGVNGAKRGPAPAHDIGIWVGAYKPRMLRLVGGLANGWLPSLSYLPGGPSALEEMNKHIDEGAAATGRDPSAIRRFLNINGRFVRSEEGFLEGPPDVWAQQLAELTLRYGTSGFILAADDPTTIERFAAEVVPATKELVADSRTGRHGSDQEGPGTGR